MPNNQPGITIAQQLQSLLPIGDESKTSTVQALKKILRQVQPEDSIATSFFYINGGCELSVRIEAAIRCPSDRAIEEAIAACAAPLSDLGKLDALASL